MENAYGTLSQTINGLKKEGYTLDFNLQQECLVCHHINIAMSPDDFEIDAVYRFEGDSNPDDESILYAISSLNHNVKGLLVDAYGIYSEGMSAALVEKLQRRD